MSATSLAPMMCFQHPNGLRSILKYPGVICGSADHTSMLVFAGILLVVFVFGFVALCGFAVWKVPWLQTGEGSQQGVMLASESMAPLPNPIE